MLADVPLKKIVKMFQDTQIFFFLKMGPIPVTELADTSGYIIQTYLCSIQCFGGEVVE